MTLRYRGKMVLNYHDEEMLLLCRTPWTSLFEKLSYKVHLSVASPIYEVFSELFFITLSNFCISPISGLGFTLL